MKNVARPAQPAEAGRRLVVDLHDLEGTSIVQTPNLCVGFVRRGACARDASVIDEEDPAVGFQGIAHHAPKVREPILRHVREPEAEEHEIEPILGPPLEDVRERMLHAWVAHALTVEPQLLGSETPSKGLTCGFATPRRKRTSTSLGATDANIRLSVALPWVRCMRSSRAGPECVRLRLHPHSVRGQVPVRALQRARVAHLWPAASSGEAACHRSDRSF
jgi:hypothetical protein